MRFPSPYPIYVVILNWNLAKETIMCIDSIREGSPSDVKIVVVDNASTDHSVQRLWNHFGDSVKIIENAENLGFAGGVNVGIQWAMAEGAQSILMLNNDTIVAPDMIDHLTVLATRAPRWGVVGPIIYYYDLPERVWCIGSREYRWLPVPLDVSARALSKTNAEPFQLDYANACGMLIKRQVFETVGLFDSRYFFYFEDSDFCRRAREAGYEIWCTPKAKMWHKVSLTMAKHKPAMRYTEWWGRAQFYRTHPHGFFRGLTYAYLLTKVVKTTLCDLLSQDWKLIKALWAGAFEGFYGKRSRHFDFFGR